jgi:hypothetical protein
MAKEIRYRQKVLKYEHKGKKCEIGILDDDARVPDPELDGLNEPPYEEQLARKVRLEQEMLAKLFRGEDG